MNLQSPTDNIRFRSDAIVKCFDGHRDKWDEFYPSERWAFERLANQRQGRLGRLLDVGCAVGGLGLALSSRFALDSYTGVDINAQAIELARARAHRFQIPAAFHCDDVVAANQVPRASFDVVTSLGCADWNIATGRIIERCWECVAPGGSFVMSVRLTNREGINDFSRSHQPFAWDDNGAVLESANYVVFNWKEYLALCGALQPSPRSISGYGYWGKPAGNAITPYERLVFGVVIIQKPTAALAEEDSVTVDLELPLDLLTA